ncbi:MAG TPA: beta-glucosidase BglX [Candidatus Saccharimonadales bacterium]|nr:beta-glucosidase BglX [Candidatus Saccharimonadales bacterium]
MAKGLFENFKKALGEEFWPQPRLATVLFATLIAGNLLAQTPAAGSSMGEYVSGLLGQMTLEEKIGQLNLLSTGFDTTGPVASQNVETAVRNGSTGGVFNLYTPARVRKLQEVAVGQSRLHIPLLFGYDVIHGHKTIFPIPLALSCTWDPEWIEKSARMAADEASADGVNWTFSPMVDIARDPRWGRIAEGAGEDPYLGGVIARAMVMGYQGSDLAQSNAVLACVKHFALYGAVEAGRDYNPADMSRLTMFQYYLPPYQAAVEAGVGSVMASFNEVEGVPATGNRWLLTDLLRRQWGFKGFVVSDYTAINEMTMHGMGGVPHDAALALKAGLDMDMVSEAYVKYLKDLVSGNAVTEPMIDAACRRILEAKYKLGLFVDPYHGCSDARAEHEILTSENRKFARDIAERSFVLLKNDAETLPLKRSGVLALIGPLADSRRDVLGPWSAAGDWKLAINVLDGIKQAAGPSLSIVQARGANLIDDRELLETLNASGASIVPDKRSPQEMIAEAVQVASNADVVVAVLGESFAMSGEAASRSEIGLPLGQEELLRAVQKTGKPIVLVLMNGRPLTLPWEESHCSAILETWFAGMEAGNAVADVLFGDYNPSARLTTTFPRSVGQIPLYYNHKNTGRPYNGNPRVRYESRYLDVPNTPLYPFGFGLSYTSFSYSDVKLSKNALKGDETLVATVDVTNTGKRAGEETVQLYISEPAASVTRSVEDLRSFQKVTLEPGQKQGVTFNIRPQDLKFYNSDLVYDWEAGSFVIRIGPNSSQLKSATVRWEK